MTAVTAGNWRDHGLCGQIGGEPFFPDPGDHTGPALAMAACRSCPARIFCLDYAMETDQGFGIWGGYAGRALRAVRRRRAAGESAEDIITADDEQYYTRLEARQAAAAAAAARAPRNADATVRRLARQLAVNTETTRPQPGDQQQLRKAAA